MAVQIKQIRFQNYRQYGTGSFSFEQKPEADSQLFAFIAPNGTGKTTLLQMIIWCLYGEETPGAMSSQNEKKLPLVNTRVLRQSASGACVPVSVSIRFDVDGNLVDFKRSVLCEKRENGRVRETKMQFSSVYTPGNGGNSQTHEGEQADLDVKQYFDKAIYNFYFFDGEKLSDFFRTPLKDSIYNIAQVSLLENIVNHTNTLKNTLGRELGQTMPDIGKKQEAVEAKQKALDEVRQLFATEQENIHRQEMDIQELETQIRGFEPVRKIQEERDKLSRRQKELEQDWKEFVSEKNTFVRKFLILLNLYPRIKALHEYIQKKSAQGQLPPAIDRDQIIKLLEHPEMPCPLCGSHLTETARRQLQALLNYYEVSSRTANLLSSFQSPLEELLKDARNYEMERDNLLQKERKLRAEIKETEEELEEKDKAISQYGGDAGGKKFVEMDHRLHELRKANQNSCRMVGQLGNQKEIYKKELEALEQEMKALNAKADTAKESRAKYEVLCNLSHAFRAVKDHIVSETKTDMQALTWKFFSEMIWKKNTFGNILIDDAYNVTVYDRENQVMTESLSATEKMALAYSFTLAVHEISGKNCPLVIDSPLGRVSDENRERMARALLEVARNKQIIMLFTPDEYSPAVAKLYEREATVRTLKLSADESYVEGFETDGTGAN